MNIKFSPETTPCGTRFLYRGLNPSTLNEGTIREWSESGKYCNFEGGWITINDLNNYTIVEMLPLDHLWRKA